MIVRVKAGDVNKIIKVCTTFNTLDNKCATAPKTLGVLKLNCNKWTWYSM